MIGNNGIWALEKNPMESLYDTFGWPPACDDVRYDKLAEARG
jgi:hypothetical protein